MILLFKYLNELTNGDLSPRPNKFYYTFITIIVQHFKLKIFKIRNYVFVFQKTFCSFQTILMKTIFFEYLN